MKLLAKLREEIGSCGVLVQNGDNYAQVDAALATLDEFEHQLANKKHYSMIRSWSNSIDDILNMESKS